jgi:flagellar biosynthesis/type III secretory pathway protein FliH
MKEFDMSESANHYFVDHLAGENYNIVDAGGSVLVTLRRTSRTQAEAVRDAMEYTRAEGESKAGSFQDGYEHGVAVGMREAREESYEEGYAAGRRDYHEELWNRGTDIEAEV